MRAMNRTRHRISLLFIACLCMLTVSFGTSYRVYRAPGKALLEAGDSTRYVYADVRIDTFSSYAPEKLLRVEDQPRRKTLEAKPKATLLYSGRSIVEHLYLPDTTINRPDDLRWFLDGLHFKIGVDEFRTPLTAIDSLALTRYSGVPPWQRKTLAKTGAVIVSVFALYLLIYSNFHTS